MKVLMCLMVLLPISRCAKILAVVPLDIESHHRFSRPILMELTNRGHQVTVISPIRDTNPPKNYRQIVVPALKMWDAVSHDDNTTAMSPNTNVFINSQMDLRNRTFIITEKLLRSQALQSFLAEDGRGFDLVMCEMFHIQPFLMFGHVNRAPVVALSALGHGHFVNQQTRNPYELSYVSHENLNLPRRYKFFDRLRNAFWTAVDLFERDTWSSELDEMANKYFKNNDETLPKLKELERNVSLVLVNSHRAIDTIRPNVPAVVEVGGLHVTTPKKLPTALQNFLDDAKVGAIYVNLHSDIVKSDVAKSKLSMFSKVFNFHREYKFVWQQHENDELLAKSDNVFTVKSLSQSDILAHENVKVFITHGGQLNIQDAVSRAVPVVCIPTYGDQFSSCARSKEKGAAEVLPPETLSETSLSDALRKLTTDLSYGKSAQKLEQLFRENPAQPLDAAVFWIEHVLEHGGAEHLRSPAMDLYWYEYYMLDTIAVMVLAVYYLFCGISWMFWNVVLRKKVPRDDIQHLIEKQKVH